MLRAVMECHGSMRGSQMSWKKLFAADDVSTRRVERVLMWTLTDDANADVQ